MIRLRSWLKTTMIVVRVYENNKIEGEWERRERSNESVERDQKIMQYKKLRNTCSNISTTICIFFLRGEVERWCRFDHGWRWRRWELSFRKNNKIEGEGERERERSKILKLSSPNIIIQACKIRIKWIHTLILVMTYAFLVEW